MSFTALGGAGALGGAIAHRLASRDRTRDVRLIDVDGPVARGKALDILQSSPIEGFSARVSAADRLEAAAGADVIVIADAAGGDAEHAGETGLALVRRIAACETTAPLLFAGAGQRELMARTVTELHVRAGRVIGSAPGALTSAVRALAALELDGTGVDVQLLVVGVPPRGAVIAWEGATAAGQPLSALVPAHRLAALSARLPGLWPPGPLALASAAARVAEALAHGSRRRYTCFVFREQPPERGAVVALPVAIRRGGLERVLQPALSRQEQTQLDNALAGSIS
jgi:malate dehydrogenase